MGNDAAKSVGLSDRLQAYAAAASYLASPLTSLGIAAGLTKSLAGAKAPTQAEVDTLAAESNRDPYAPPNAPSLPMLPGGPGPGAGGAIVRTGGAALLSGAGIGGAATALTAYGAIRDAVAAPALAVANAAYKSVKHVETVAAATQGTGGSKRPVDDKHVGRVDLADVERACNDQIAGLSAEERARIGMRNGTDIENHFNGNANMAREGLDRFAKRAADAPERLAAYEKYKGTVRDNRTYIPAGYRAAVTFDTGNPVVRIVAGSGERPAASLPWKAAGGT